jgi:hypothetical protein
MGLGIKALNYSASEAFVEAETSEEVEVALTPAVIEGEGRLRRHYRRRPGSLPRSPNRSGRKDELKRGATAAAASSIVFAIIFNILLFVAAPCS